MSTGKLAEALDQHDRICILYSGGFDSQVLLRACVSLAGRDRTLALTARSPLLAGFYRRLITGTVRELAVRHCFVDVDILSEENFAQGGPERCYLCKKAIIRELGRKALEQGCNAIMDGTLPEDLKEHRPGLRAAAEAGVIHPFVDVGMDGPAVAELGISLGADPGMLPSDSCLATRIPVGRKIDSELLETVETVESLLRSSVRGRLRARILPDELVLDYSPVDEQTVMRKLRQLQEAALSRRLRLRLNRL